MTERADYTGEPGPTGPAGADGPTGPEGPPGTTTWAGITDKPTEFAPEAHKTSHEAGGSDELLAALYKNTFTRPGRLFASDGTTLKPMSHAYCSYQLPAAIGDRMQMFFLCTGTETRLCLSTYKTNTQGKWDLYINGVLDSSGYDDYSGSAAEINRYITLTQQINAGLNTVALHVDSKNALSTGYYVFVFGASLQ